MEYVIETLSTPLCELTIFQWVIVIIATLLIIGVVGFLVMMQYFILPMGLFDKAKGSDE